MAQCSACGAEFEPPRTAPGMTICPACVRKKDAAARKDAETPKRSSGNMRLKQVREQEERAFTRIAEALEEVRGMQKAIVEKSEVESEQERDRAAQKRAHARHEVSLQMAFAYLRDDRRYEAKVEDVSKGGLRFVTAEELRPGQVLSVHIHSPGQPEGETKKLENFIEVRRVTPTEDGLFRAGARFIRRIGVDATNRRAQPRRSIETPVFYKREGSSLIQKGMTVDISKGGARFLTDEPPNVGESLELALRTEPPAFAHAELRGPFRVVRVSELGVQKVDVGGTFGDLQVIPLDEEGVSTGPSASGEPQPEEG